MYVRSFRLVDYASVTKLLDGVLSSTCYDETIEAFARQLSWDSELVLVAEDDDEIVGVIIGTIDDNHGYYYRIAVDTPHQRKGIGKAMIQALKDRFKQRKVSKIIIPVDAHNEPVIPLFQALGYQENDFMRSVTHLSIVNG
jgi:ribosomal protein S18 acetylase RimI-like enzyme